MAVSARRTATGTAVLAATLVVAWLPSGAAVAETRDIGQTVIASQLDNPRGLALDKHGQLIVGEAGHAGRVCTAAPGELGPTCIGFTSRISSIDPATGERRTLASGFPSVGTAVGATGIDGVTTQRGKVYGIITGSPLGIPAAACGTGSTPGCADVVARAARQLGDLVSVSGHSRHSRTVADVGTYDYRWIVDHKAALGATANPDFQPGDSNPYGVAPAEDGGFYVVDAGSNTLDLVDRHGDVSVLAYLPDPPGPPDQRFPYDSVPTCVVPSDDGVWIGTLSGQVYLWDGLAATLVADRTDGLTAINGCGADNDGNLYAANIFGATPDKIFAPHTGFVSKITVGGTVTTVAGTQGMSFPAGVAVDRHTLYVVTESICPKDLALVGAKDPPVCEATGQVVRLSI